ncbi:MAG TPA: hypothetical protein VG870_04055 [Chitinophagaceae bacterium]|nr:hypothetical protein [Chitinophagaceae bacterium]
MNRTWLITLVVIGLPILCPAQEKRADTASASKVPVTTSPAVDDLDDLGDITLDDLTSFLDSLLLPHSYFLASLQAGKGFYSYDNRTGYLPATYRLLTLAPVIGYYHKSGLGITGSGYVVNDQGTLNFFQGAVSPSYDYLANRNFATGISYTRFFTRDSLSFYTSPLLNEVSAYFGWRKAWIKPTLLVTYGWGSRTAYKERARLIHVLRLRRRGYTRIRSTETVQDFSLTLSVRHDFYWLNVISRNDHVRLTPQLAFTGGTQQFGFNQSATTYLTPLKTAANILYSSGNSYLDDQSQFQPLALTFYLRTEYSIGKFFLQPQLIFDYYFPDGENHLNTRFSVNAGVML